MTIFSYALAEGREHWRSRRPAAIAGAAFVSGLAASFSWMGPALLSVILPLSALILGWHSGARYATDGRFRKLLLGSGLSAPAAALARAIEATAEAVIAAFVLSPPAILGLALWDRGIGAGVMLILSFIAAFLVAAAAAFPASLLLGGRGFLSGLGAFAAWLPLVSFAPTFKRLSPFAQAWDALGAIEPALSASIAGIGIELLIAALLFAAAVPAIETARRRDAAA